MEKSKMLWQKNTPHHKENNIKTTHEHSHLAGSDAVLLTKWEQSVASMNFTDQNNQ